MSLAERDIGLILIQSDEDSSVETLEAEASLKAKGVILKENSSHNSSSYNFLSPEWKGCQLESSEAHHAVFSGGQADKHRGNSPVCGHLI